MRAVQSNQPGGPDVLTISEIEKPTVGPEQLLIRVHACGLNRADLLQRRGKYSPPPGESNILGLEIAGEVVAVGDKAHNHKIGDRVFGLVGSGAYAEYCAIDHQVAMPIPKNLSYIEAAATAEAFLTASEAMFTLGNLQEKESILIHAGGSGVGTAAIQLAHQVNAIIYTTYGDEGKKEKLKTLHPDAMINYKQENFADEIQKLTNKKGVDVIIDFIGASYLMQNLQSLTTQGRLTCVGLMGGSKTEIDMDRILRQRLQIKGLMMRTRSIADKRAIAKRFIERWLPLFSSGKLKPVIDSVFLFSAVVDAHKHMESNTNFGKIILDLG